MEGKNMGENLDNLFGKLGLELSNKKSKESLTPEDGLKEVEAKHQKKAEMEKRTSFESRQAAKQMYEQMLRDAEAGKKTPLTITQIRQALDTMEKEKTEKEK